MSAALVADNLAAARQHYAQEIRFVGNIQSKALIAAFGKVPREHFLGPGPWQILSGNMESYWPTEDADPKHIYHNVLVAIDPARRLNNGEPSFLARLCDALDLKHGDRVLHIGCGTGYYSAILAETVGSRGHVTAIEVDPDLAAKAERNLSPWTNVKVIAADGSGYRPEPADAIFVNAGATHPLPMWLDILRPGGRLVLPLTAGRKIGGRVLKLVRGDHGYPARFISYVWIFDCAGARDEDARQRLQTALASDSWQNVQSLRREPHAPDESCWLHGADFCLSMKEATAGTH